MAEARRKGPMVIAGLAILLAILHHDFWLWTDKTLVFGFIPSGLFYHALYSVACACLWFAAITFAWPEQWEIYADGGELTDDAPPAASTSDDSADAQSEATE